MTEHLPNTESVFAQEGTAAHALAELSLKKQVDPSTYIGVVLEGVEVTEDMADAVRVYTEYCLVLMEYSIATWIEKRFNLAALNPPRPMFGTSDFVAYDVDTRTLEVVDLKYGQGVVVEAKDNPQLRYYALGAAMSMDPRTHPIEKVKITIVQPRAAHTDGPIRSEEVEYLDLLSFASVLLEAARRTVEPDAPLNSGSWCRFCPASGACPEQKRRAQVVAQSEFATLPAQGPPNPELMTRDELLDIMSKLPILEDFAAAVRARVQGALERGEEMPGFKLVAKRGTRQWIDEDEAVQRLISNGLGDEDIYVRKIKSPAQIEKGFGGKKKFEKALGDVVEKRSSGYSMVSAADARPAIVLKPGSEFALLPSASSSSTEGREESE